MIREEIQVKKFSDVGMGELFMSRLYHFQDNILNGLFGFEKNKETKQSIMNVLFDGLEPACRSLRKLRKSWDDENVPEKEKRQDIENVYSYLTIAFKDRFQQTANLMGYDIGFLFQNDTNFEAGCKEFIQRHPGIDSHFIEVVKDDRLTWSKLLIDVRNNVIDHAANKDPQVLRDLEQNMTLDSVEKVFDNCWRAMEDYLAVFAIDKTDSKYGSEILELLEYRQSKDHPQRFGWFSVKEK